MGRSVRTVLVDASGLVCGVLPFVELEAPFWQETADLVAAIRERFGVEVVVLRLLSAERAHPPGGRLTVLAQARPFALAGVPALEPVGPELFAQLTKADPRRMRWAEVGGPDRSLAWARAALGSGDWSADQQRTWNLSSLWRLERPSGERAWLKQVPHFFRHEDVWSGDLRALPRGNRG